MSRDVGFCLPGKKRAVRDLRACFAETVDAHLLNCDRCSGYAWLDRMVGPSTVERQKKDAKAGGARLCVVMRRFIMLINYDKWYNQGALADLADDRSP